MNNKTKNRIRFLSLLLVVILIVWDQSSHTIGLEKFETEIKKVNGHNEELPPKEFYTDGCSLFPDEIFNISWKKSCIEHDIKYWLGGTEEERLSADKQLRKEINQTVPFFGDIAYLGVRLGGRNLIPLIPFPWGWGYGWDAEKEN